MGNQGSFGHVGDDQNPKEILLSRSGPQDYGISQPYLLRRAEKAHGAAVVLTQEAGSEATLAVFLDGAEVGLVVVHDGQLIGTATFDANAGYSGTVLQAAWATNPPVGGCTVHVDLV